MYYRLNIALNGRHYFATAPESIHTQEHLQDAVQRLRPVFTEEAGFKITATVVTTVSHNIEV